MRTSQVRQNGFWQKWQTLCALLPECVGQGTFTLLLCGTIAQISYIGPRAPPSASRGPPAAAMRINLPNALTLLRIFLVPFLVVVLLTKFDGRETVGLLIFLTAVTTDFLDGFLARRRGEITTLGTLLDPIADKLLISAAFISLVELGLAPAWMVVVVIGREFAVSGLRSIAAERGIVIPASGWGKAKMGTQIARRLAPDPRAAPRRLLRAGPRRAVGGRGRRAHLGNRVLRPLPAPDRRHEPAPAVRGGASRIAAPRGFQVTRDCASRAVLSAPQERFLSAPQVRRRNRKRQIGRPSRAYLSS